ncbi:hypothetical protein [Burkholderia ubonensis]|uniref:hypothetical protein n=1 Tax=Burkholderia ubonensis TaxID=101571 RepID=UPI000AD0337F|nr:hypothetical protein [Burkholderia ubonensis]
MKLATLAIVACSILSMTAFSGCTKKVSDRDVVDVRNARYLIDGNAYTLHDGHAPIYGQYGNTAGQLQLDNGKTQTSADLDNDGAADTIVFLKKKEQDEKEILYVGISLSDRLNQPIDTKLIGVDYLSMDVVITRDGGVIISFGGGYAKSNDKKISFDNVNGKPLRARLIEDEGIEDVVWRHVKWNLNRALKLVRGE